MHFLLRAVPDNDILAFRRQGRLIWERYFGTAQGVIDTVIAVIRDRLGIPPLPARQTPSPSVFNETFIVSENLSIDSIEKFYIINSYNNYLFRQPLKADTTMSESDAEESLGPLEPAYPSPAFKRNYTTMLIQGSEMWNDWFIPFKLYPQLPFDTFLPSDAKFIGESL